MTCCLTCSASQILLMGTALAGLSGLAVGGFLDQLLMYLAPAIQHAYRQFGPAQGEQAVWYCFSRIVLPLSYQTGEPCWLSTEIMGRSFSNMAERSE